VQYVAQRFCAAWQYAAAQRVSSHRHRDDRGIMAHVGASIRGDSMRTLFGIVSVVAILVSSPVQGTSTVSGELVDLQCQLKESKNKGADHAECALSCAKRGATLGILTGDSLFTVTGDYTRENNRRLIAFVAKPVVAIGTVTEKDGKKLIDVTSIELVTP
jgi:hypothetical protein